MSTFFTTGCIFHPFQQDSKCITCNTIISDAAYTTMSGTSDFLASVYPEINTSTAGPAAYVSPKKAINSVAKPNILSSFTISRDFHPGQFRVEDAAADYSESFTLDLEPIVLRTFYISKDFHPGQTRAEDEDAPYSELFALDAEDRGVPKKSLRKARGPDKRPRKRARKAVQPISVPSKQTASNKKATKSQDPEESEAEGDTIVVDISDSEEEPIQQARKRLQAAQDELVLALIAEKKNKKGNTSQEPQAKSRGTKRSRQAAESSESDEEPLAKKTRSSKRAKIISEESEEEPIVSSTRSRTKKAAKPTIRRSLRGRSSVSYTE